MLSFSYIREATLASACITFHKPYFLKGSNLLLKKNLLSLGANSLLSKYWMRMTAIASVLWLSLWKQLLCSQWKWLSLWKQLLCSQWKGRLIIKFRIISVEFKEDYEYSKTCLEWPLKNRQNKDLNDKWLLNEGQKYYRMLPLEHSAILLTCIKQ